MTRSLGSVDVSRVSWETNAKNVSSSFFSLSSGCEKMKLICFSECEQGKYGANCLLSCDCESGCDPITGRCQCDLGYMGANCQQSKLN